MIIFIDRVPYHRKLALGHLHLQSVRSGGGHRPLVASGIAELVAVGGSEVVEDRGATRS